MPGTLQPLDGKFAIVDASGNPTEYFTRWAQQKQIDIGDSITLADLQAYLTAHKLIAGTGIQLTPDGDINDGVTIHADAQAILDEITVTRGTILYRGLLGWAALLPDTSGKVLSTNGAGADPSWITPAAGGGGALVLLEQHTAAASASLDFTTAISATYDEYFVEFVNILPATNATKLYMRMSTNGGVSYDAAGNYSYSALASNRFSTSTVGADSGATQIQLINSSADNTVTGGGIHGSLRLFSPASAAQHKAVRASLMFLTSGTLESCESSGFYRSVTPVNAFQFLMSAGNIASGTIRVYGIAK